MSAFANSNFPATLYSLTRPTYPPRLFEYVFNYHKRKDAAEWDRALDIGCGTGQATTALTRFHEVIGLDPSEKMIRAIRANRDLFPSPTPSRSPPVGGTGSHRRSGQKFSFGCGNAEDMARSGILDSSVDLVIAAQACHWFDWTKVWPEVERVLKPGGTAAFWVYSEFRLPQYPSVTPLITDYAQGTDSSTSLGPHWERPGRTVLERHLLDVPSPEKVLGKGGKLAHEERCYFAGNYHTDTLPVSRTFPVIMQKEMRWRDLLGYFRTWSALEKYRMEHPIKDGIDVRGGDLPVRFWKDLRQAASEEEKKAKVEVDDKVTVEWPPLVHRSPAPANLYNLGCVRIRCAGCILELYLTRSGPFVSIPPKVLSGSGSGQSSDCKSCLLSLSQSSGSYRSSFAAFWIGYSTLPEWSLKGFLPMDYRGASYSRAFF